MHIVAIIQARTGSTRLPRKVLLDICGQTMLARVVNRTRRAEKLNDIIIATTTNSKDDAIVDECRKLDVLFFRGSEDDVLDRYYQAAQKFRADAIVRITSDCPLIDSDVIDNVLQIFLKENPDYASNTIHRTYPRGLDVEVMTMDSLARAWREAAESHQRVHVTPYIYQNPNLFRLYSVTNEKNYSRYRWTVDTEKDSQFVRVIYDKFNNRDNFSWKDVIMLLTREPELSNLNYNIQQKSLEDG